MPFDPCQNLVYFQGNTMGYRTLSKFLEHQPCQGMEQGEVPPERIPPDNTAQNLAHLL